MMVASNTKIVAPTIIVLAMPPPRLPLKMTLKLYPTSCLSLLHESKLD